MWSDTVSRRFNSRLNDVFAARALACVSEVPGAAEAYLVWSLRSHFSTSVLWVADGPRTLQTMHRNLLAISPPNAPLLYFPSWETLPGKRADHADVETAGERLSVLSILTRPEPRPVVATCIQALMQPTLSRDQLSRNTLRLAVGQESDPADLAAAIERLAYEFVPEVQEKAKAALRGGILDIWPPAETWPLRLEFFGSAIESIRAFDPLDQRSRERREEARVTPASEWRFLERTGPAALSLIAHMPADSIVVWSRQDDIQAHAAVYQETVLESAARDLCVAPEEICRRVREMPNARQLYVGNPPEEGVGMHVLDFTPLHGVSSLVSDALHPDVMEQARRRFLTELAGKAAGGQAVYIFFDTPGDLERYRTDPTPCIPLDRVHLRVGTISEGFSSEDLGLAIVSESDLYGRRKTAQGRYEPRGRRAGPQRVAGARVSDWADIEPGDLVVHVEHGVGRYLGLQQIRVNDQLQEVLAIEYSEKARLYVPVSQTHLLTRYVGVGKRYRSLHRLGGKQWSREKAAAERSVRDLASSLLEIQGARNALPGHAFAADTPWQHQFEAAFPYVETEDQEKAIVEVKADMQNTRPMDRLICGDAGYGKTEVAMRAAFKAVMEGKQVAVLVPTTVLAQQHFYTFTERMAAYPIRIEMLSRFCSPVQHNQVVEDLCKGTVDIVIGTHSLIQPGIEFHDLGLVIIDEEQRFGVLHKERFKQIRRLVNVLTLTATPIPRTLYLSLLGSRDLSTIQTPPQDRLTIETIVTAATDEVIREAVLREVNREGQVYYLHNRVRTIERVRTRLEELVPEARIEVAHGQMPTSQLARVMQSFVTGELNVLLCTTIIESGLDIPGANTILIDRADRFGMADLYQLRGRVGRSKRKAYAYMLLPVHAHIDPTARKRIEAIRQYTDHGAGFRLAMRDLEIRGAGNLLGAEQSGHIGAVGFALYCQLLRRTVAGMKNEPIPPIIDVDVKLDFIDLSPAAAQASNSAFIPLAYLEDERLRVGTYRRIAEAALPDDIRVLQEEFVDRFGPVPSPLERLLKIASLRILAAAHGITSMEVAEGKIMLTGKDGYIMKAGRFPRLRHTAPDDRLDELIRHLKGT